MKLSNLNNGVLSNIFCYLDLKDTYSLISTSKKFNCVISNDNLIWKSFCEGNWGEFNPYKENDYEIINYK